MKISFRPLVPALLAFSLAILFQLPAAAAAQAGSPASGEASTPSPAAAPETPNRADAYYHFQMGHLDEDMAASTGSAEMVDKAIEEYKAALKDDPNSSYLALSLAELYARTGNIRDAVRQAQDIITRDPDNLDAHRLLGHIYLRSVSALQRGTSAKEQASVLALAVAEYQQIVRLDPTSIEDHLLLGRLYRLNGETAKAEGEFRSAVKLQPDSEEAVSTLALLYNEEGDPARALNILLAVPESDRTSRIQSVIGYTYSQQKDYAHAVDAYRKAVSLDSDDLDATRGLAEALLNNRQPDAALEQYKKIADADPQDASTLLHIAEIYRQNGEFDKSLEVLKKAQAVVQGSMEIDYTRALVEEAMGKFDDAAHILEDLVQRTQSSTGTVSEANRNNRAIFLERLGNVYRDQNNTTLALATYRNMLTLGDDAAIRGYQLIVDCQREARDYKSALATSREAAAKFPKDSGLQMLLAAQEADFGNPDAALARVKAMLKGKASGDRDVWITLAQMNARLRRWPAAEKAIAKAMALSTKREDKDYANFLAGSIYERQKKYAEAERDFRKVLASDPRSATTLNYLGYMLADRGTRLDEALGMIRRAVALDPQNGAYLDSLGWVNFKMGKYDLAETFLRKAAERMDNDPTVHEHLGDLYQKTNRLKLAVTQWERSLQQWKSSLPGDVEPGAIAKVQKKLDAAKVKLARDNASK
jgi:tetratricopeptide (TPR) repeat protein